MKVHQPTLVKHSNSHHPPNGTAMPPSSRQLLRVAFALCSLVLDCHKTRNVAAYVHPSPGSTNVPRLPAPPCPSVVHAAVRHATPQWPGQSGCSTGCVPVTITSRTGMSPHLLIRHCNPSTAAQPRNYRDCSTPRRGAPCLFPKPGASERGKIDGCNLPYSGV